MRIRPRSGLSLVLVTLACGGDDPVATDGATSTTTDPPAPTTTTDAPPPPDTSTGPGPTTTAVTTTDPTTTTAPPTTGEPTDTTDTTSTTGTGTTTGAPGSLVVLPADPALVVELPLTGQTVAFQCIDTLTDLPVDLPVWSLDSDALGAIDQDGVFTPNGAGVGSVVVTCDADDLSAQTSLQLGLHLVDNPDGLTPDEQDQLLDDRVVPDPTWKILYPYDDTVFPRDIPAPQIHLTPGDFPADQYAVRITAPAFTYEGFFVAPPDPTRLVLPDPSWDLLTAVAAGQTVQIEITKRLGDQTHGVLSQPWRIADGALHGVIYYNSYDSPQIQNGAIFRVDPASATPEPVLTNCTTCHSASHDGSTLAGANHSGPGGTFDLMTAPPASVWVDAERAAYAAIHPDGDLLVTQGNPGASYPPNTPGTSFQATSELRTRAGDLLPASGIEPYYAQTPAFSPDGALLAFNDRSAQSMGNYWPGALAVLSFDVDAQAFTAHDVLTTPPQGRQHAWPTFTPDGATIVYQDGVGEDLATWAGNTGKLWAVDIASKQTVALARLNGDGYVPQGARDEDKNYEPSISPIPSGGYAWVVFTSRRTYGNALTGPADVTKRLWVAALDLGAPPGTDASHPAFYLPGQELMSGNHRGAFVLAPCAPASEPCASGDQCCDGHCNAGVCAPADGDCADEFEPCTAPADCCDPAHACINARCAAVP